MGGDGQRRSNGWAERTQIEAEMKDVADTGSRLWRALILVGAGLFLVALALSALLIPQLRILHILQAFIYIAVVRLSQRNSPLGFGAGVVIATIWNGLSLFITGLFQVGVGQLLAFVQTGHSSRPDTLMVAVGGVGHFLLIAGCLGAFLRLRPSLKLWGRFVAGGLLAAAYFALIIVTTAPR
jgi:hypothetical protein